jgi:hypothetical protein
MPENRHQRRTAGGGLRPIKAAQGAMLAEPPDYGARTPNPAPELLTSAPETPDYGARTPDLAPVDDHDLE